MTTWKYGAVLALALAACGGGKGGDTGSVSVNISGAGLSGAGAGRGALTTTTPGPNSAGQVSYVVLTHTGPDGGGSQRIDAVTNPISVLLNALPVGAYTFSAIAYDASDAALFASTGATVSVYKNTVTGVNLILQQLAPPGTFTGTSPLIGSIVVSDVTPATGETIALTATVLDDTSELAYQWSSSCSDAPAQADVFSAPTSTSTTLTSYCTGVETITFSVTEINANGGGTSTVTFALTYAAQGANASLVLNSWPDVLAIATPNRQPDCGGTISVTGAAQDADGDALTYAWADSCGGTFTNGTTLTPTWTAPAKPGGTKPAALPIPCKLRLTVTDSKGGTNSGWLAINVGKAIKTLVKRYALPRFAYVVNRTDSTVSAYSVNVDTGALTAVGAPVATGASPSFVTAAPSGEFAYVIDGGSAAMSVYTVGSGGALTKAGDDVTFGGTPYSVAIDPSSQFAFVGAGTSVAAYPIDPNTGALGTPAPAATLNSVATFLTVDPSGRFLFAAVSNTVWAFAISPTGALTQVGSALSTGSTAYAVSVEPSGRFLYAVSANNTVLAFSIDASTGALTAVGSQPTGASPRILAIEPSGKFLYVGNYSDRTISAYAIDAASGALTSLGAPVATTSPRSIVADPSGKFLYAVNSSSSANTVSVFTIAADGTLADAGIPAATGTLPYSVAMTGVYPPPVLYVANDGGWNRSGGTGLGASISAFSVDRKSGALTSLGAPVAAGQGTYSLALHPAGRFLYASSANYDTYADGAVLVYGVDPATGALTALGSAPFPAAAGINYPTYVRVHPSGKFVYACSVPARARDTLIAVYGVDPQTGLLTLASTFSPNSAPQGMAVDPSGKFFLAGTNNGYGITAYDIDPDTGALSLANSVLRPNPYGYGFAVDPFGRFVFQVTNNYAGGTIGRAWAYTLDPDTGALALANNATTIGTTPARIAIDPSGRFAYVSDLVADNGLNKGYIEIYAIDAAGGFLTSLGAVETSSIGGPGQMVFDPSGSFLYANGGTGNSDYRVGVFAVDPFTGWLTDLGLEVPTGSIDNPAEMAISAGLAPWAVVTTTPAAPAAPTFTVGGTASGLSGTVVLQDNGGDDLPVSASGAFTFATPLAQGAAYAVTVKDQPQNQTCLVENGAGTMGSADVSDVVVTCTANPASSFTVGGTVSGLGGTVVLQNNAGDDLTLTNTLAQNGNGPFTFATALAQGASYAVTVKTQPNALQTCAVSNGVGTVGDANVTSVGVVCTGFGAACSASTDCSGEFDVCGSVNQLPNGCTKACTGDADCPVGSNGTQKCNTAGICRW
jgi:6-phosphogluconolactonase